ncbi:hypothetical protein ACFFI1_34210, partial [Methylobacterium isbiliense]|uniref:hypothetical protein n=1 Tax=Methylobacterium isbiliense TaxID=315478 RepID=UPI0035ED4FDF
SRKTEEKDYINFIEMSDYELGLFIKKMFKWSALIFSAVTTLFCMYDAVKEKDKISSEPERRNTPLSEAAVWSLPLWGRGGLHTHAETSASGDLLE